MLGPRTAWDKGRATSGGAGHMASLTHCIHFRCSAESSQWLPAQDKQNQLLCLRSAATRATTFNCSNPSLSIHLSISLLLLLLGQRAHISTKDMSTTFFQVLSDDPQLEKQIGCMTGLLQIFDRQQALRGKRCGRSTRRMSSSGAAKALPPPLSPNNAAAWKESSAATDMVVLELGHRESCSAHEQSSSTSSRSQKLLRPSSSPSQAEFKEAAEPKRGGSVDLKESLRLLAKLKEAPWNHNREASAVPSRLLVKDAPRLSYDGVRSCFEFKDALRASQRARDAPRLSLDGTRPSSTEIRMRPTSNVVARLMGLEELPDPSYPCSTTKTSQGSSRSKQHQSSSGTTSEDVAAAAAVGREVKPRSSSPRYLMDTMPRPPPSQDSSCSMHSKAFLTKLVAKTKPGFSQDMEKQMMYLRLEESVEQRNILKDIVEVLHLKCLLHWHGAAKLKSTNMSNQVLSASAKAECQANPRPARDISHQNVRRLNTSDGVTKVHSSRAAVKLVKATSAATSRQKNAQEMCSARKDSRSRPANKTRRAMSEVVSQLIDTKEASTTKHDVLLAKSTLQTEPPTAISQVMQEYRGSMVAADAHEQQHSPGSVLDITIHDCHPRADQVEAYVKQILDAAGWLHGVHPLRCLNSSLFLALEKGGSTMRDTKVAVMHRRLIFDCVNHILARQMQQPCCFTNSWRRPGGGQALLQQVVEELQCARFEYVGEMLQDNIVAAMSDWSSDQACELALHVERLVFKQLVDETIQDMTKLSSIRGSRNASTTRRQLFLTN